MNSCYPFWVVGAAAVFGYVLGWLITDICHEFDKFVETGKTLGRKKDRK